ncbi:MAG: DoxX family protein [Silvanigrellales bacterium]|jgi:putative oxidoreductase|nr:DoxX family protein [Silvanigrellales bacterium]
MARGGVFGLLGKEIPLFTDVGLLVMRLLLGGTMLFAHGVPKLLGFAEKQASFADPLGVGSATSLALVVGAEVGAAVTLAAGFQTRLSTLPLIIAMAVAFFVVHGADPWQRRELAFLYMVGYLSLFVSGGGRFSLDKILFSK